MSASFSLPGVCSICPGPAIRMCFNSFTLEQIYAPPMLRMRIFHWLLIKLRQVGKSLDYFVANLTGGWRVPCAPCNPTAHWCWTSSADLGMLNRTMLASLFSRQEMISTYQHNDKYRSVTSSNYSYTYAFYSIFYNIYIFVILAFVSSSFSTGPWPAYK